MLRNSINNKVIEERHSCVTDLWYFGFVCPYLYFISKLYIITLCASFNLLLHIEGSNSHVVEYLDLSVTNWFMITWPLWGVRWRMLWVYLWLREAVVWVPMWLTSFWLTPIENVWSSPRVQFLSPIFLFTTHNV